MNFGMYLRVYKWGEEIKITKVPTELEKENESQRFPSPSKNLSPIKSNRQIT